MGISNVETFGLLNRWPVIMHEDPWQFNQIAGSAVRSTACVNTYIQYERDYIARALYRATSLAADYLGFFPRPTYIEDEHLDLDMGAPWSSQFIYTKRGYIQQLGRRSIFPVAQGVEVTYTDTDSDLILDTGSFIINAGALPEQLHVFFQVADGAPGAAHPYWEIEPVTIIDNMDDTFTVSAHRSLFAHPKTVWAREYVNTTTFEKWVGDTANSASFVTHVDVYLVEYKEPLVVTGTSTTGEKYKLGADIIDPTYGGITLRKLQATDPDPEDLAHVVLSYVAGLPLINGFVESRLETALIRYANVLTPQQKCYCDRVATMWEDDNQVSPQLTQADAVEPPPFGFTNAGMNLTQVVEAMSLKYKGRERRKWPNAEQTRYLKG